VESTSVGYNCCTPFVPSFSFRHFRNSGSLLFSGEGRTEAVPLIHFRARDQEVSHTYVELWFETSPVLRPNEASLNHNYIVLSDTTFLIRSV